MNAPVMPRLHPDDLKLIVESLRDELGGVRAELAEVRQELVELREETSPGEDLMTATELANRLGKSSEWVRDHKFDLGVMLMGTGPKPRQLYSLQRALEGTTQLAESAQAPKDAKPKRRPRNVTKSAELPLLPIKGRT